MAIHTRYRTRKKKKAKKGRSEEELRTIARDIIYGKAFSDLNFRHKGEASNMIGSVFMPILLMGNKQRNHLIRYVKPQLMFEYLDKAGPIAVNGYPTFFSVQFISLKEWPVFSKHFNIILEEKRKQEEPINPEN